MGPFPNEKFVEEAPDCSSGSRTTYPGIRNRAELRENKMETMLFNVPSDRED